MGHWGTERVRSAQAGTQSQASAPCQVGEPGLRQGRSGEQIKSSRAEKGAAEPVGGCVSSAALALPQPPSPLPEST